jgi:LDH2 family malate/lactate/ureidoglycolate dehydrogenase
MNIKRPDLQRQLEAIFTVWGMSAEHAAITALRLTDADIRGIDSHGVTLVPLYAQLRSEGQINFKPNIRVLRESPVTALVDADHMLGHVPATFAMELAIDKAKKTGLAAVAVKNSNHYGAAGVYGVLAAEQGLIGMSFTSVWHGVIVPTFGAEPMFGTNPIAFVAPGKKHRTFFLDMATSTVAVGKLKLAHIHGRPLHEGWAMDQDGYVTTNPEVGLEAMRLSPLGGTRAMSSHKGYGLAAMVEILCSMMPGAFYAPTRGKRHPDAKHWNIGHFFLAIDPKAFRGEGEFEDDLDDMIDALHAVKPVDPKQPVLVAGDPEEKAMAERTRNGIPVPKNLLAQVHEVAKECGAPWLLEA